MLSRYAGAARRQALSRRVFPRRRPRGNPRLRLPACQRHRMEPVPGYAAANWEKGYGDFIMKPDLTTLRRVRWLPATALVLCNILDHHHYEPVPHAPRGMLLKQMERLNTLGMKSFFATELEFYLFDETYETAQAKGWSNLKTTGNYIQDYHVFQTTKEEAMMRAIRK